MRSTLGAALFPKTGRGNSAFPHGNGQTTPLLTIFETFAADISDLTIGEILAAKALEKRSPAAFSRC